MSTLNDFYSSVPIGRCKPCKYGKVVVAQGEYMFLGCYHEPYNGKRVSEIKECPRPIENEIPQEPISCQSCKHLNEDIEICLECEYDGTTRGMTRYEKQEPCEDTMSLILKRMWNCRGKHTTSIDKVKMEQILREELLPVNPQPNTDVLEQIEDEVLEYIDDLDIANEICGIFDKYKAERSEKE